MSDTTPLSRIDLNLLVALSVLLEERNVTRAAERLFITQPAMSKTLSRLRQLFDDPLFTRSPQGLVPTPRAEELQNQLPSIIDELEKLVFQDEFCPSEYHGTLSFALTGLTSVLIVPRLVKMLMREAPHLNLKTRSIPDNHAELLRNGSLDFSLYYQEEIDDDLLATPADINYNWMVLMRCDNPLAAKEELTPEDIYNAQHISFRVPNIKDRGVMAIHQFMEEAGITKNLILETNHFVAAMEVLADTDAICMVTEAFAINAQRQGRFAYRKLPKIEFSTDYRPQLYLLQHKRTESSGIHKWFKCHTLKILDEYSEKNTMKGA